jgi:hypothetical protein
MKRVTRQLPGGTAGGERGDGDGAVTVVDDGLVPLVARDHAESPEHNSASCGPVLTSAHAALRASGRPRRCVHIGSCVRSSPRADLSMHLT